MGVAGLCDNAPLFLRDDVFFTTGCLEVRSVRRFGRVDVLFVFVSSVHAHQGNNYNSTTTTNQKSYSD